MDKCVTVERRWEPPSTNEENSSKAPQEWLAYKKYSMNTSMNHLTGRKKNYPWESLHWPKNSFETWDLCLRSLNKTCKVLAPFPFDWALSFMMVCDVKTVFSVIAVNKIQNVGSHMPPLARQQKGEKKTNIVKAIGMPIARINPACLWNTKKNDWNKIKPWSYGISPSGQNNRMSFHTVKASSLKQLIICTFIVFLCQTLVA